MGYFNQFFLQCIIIQLVKKDSWRMYMYLYRLTWFGLLSCMHAYVVALTRNNQYRNANPICMVAMQSVHIGSYFPLSASTTWRCMVMVIACGSDDRWLYLGFLGTVCNSPKCHTTKNQPTGVTTNPLPIIRACTCMWGINHDLHDCILLRNYTFTAETILGHHACIVHGIIMLFKCHSAIPSDTLVRMFL